MSDHWGRLENEGRRQRDQRNRETADSWRRENAEWHRMKERQADLPQYPEVDDEPPGPIRFALGMIVFFGALIGCVVMCCLVVRMFLHPYR